MNVTLFGNRIFADVLKLRWDHTRLGWTTSTFQMTLTQEEGPRATHAMVMGMDSLQLGQPSENKPEMNATRSDLHLDGYMQRTFEFFSFNAFSIDLLFWCTMWDHRWAPDSFFFYCGFKFSTTVPTLLLSICPQITLISHLTLNHLTEHKIPVPGSHVKCRNWLNLHCTGGFSHDFKHRNL